LRPSESSESGMKDEPRDFLDTSALFAGIWSEAGGARALLQLAEAGGIRAIVSVKVLAEIEEAMREKAPELLGDLALALDSCKLNVITEIKQESINRAREMIEYRPDALIVAAPIDANAEFLVTHNKKHFLSNTELQRSLEFPVGTPGDFLAWYRMRIMALEETHD
jgi:predicted nucleic acid-binding protein